MGMVCVLIVTTVMVSGCGLCADIDYSDGE